MEMQTEEEDSHMGRATCASIGSVTEVSIEFVEKEEPKQRDGYEYRTEHKTRSVRNTDWKTGREESIHTQHTLMKTGK